MTVIVLLFLTLIISSGVSADYSISSVVPAPALAPIGTSFTYQGYLTDADNPANGTYDFQFMLYDDVSTGIQVGSTVNKNDVTVAEGIFMVKLDFGDFFNGTAYWLEIWVRLGASTGGYQQLLPRQPLTTVPYASYAANAPWSGLSGVPAGFADGVDNEYIKASCADMYEGMTNLSSQVTITFPITFTAAPHFQVSGLIKSGAHAGEMAHIPKPTPGTSNVTLTIQYWDGGSFDNVGDSVEVMLAYTTIEK
jgi:hypothetical protein